MYHAPTFSATWNTVCINEVLDICTFEFLLDTFNNGEVPFAVQEIYLKNIDPYIGTKDLHLLKDAFIFPEKSSNIHNVGKFIKNSNMEDVASVIQKYKGYIESLKSILKQDLNEIPLDIKRDKKIFDEIEVLFILLFQWRLNEENIVKIVTNARQNISQYLQLRGAVTPVYMQTDFFQNLIQTTEEEIWESIVWILWFSR